MTVVIVLKGGGTTLLKTLDKEVIEKKTKRGCKGSKNKSLGKKAGFLSTLIMSKNTVSIAVVFIQSNMLILKI